MPGDVKELKNSIDDKLKYIDLDLSNIPTNLNQEKKINYKIMNIKIIKCLISQVENRLIKQKIN